MKEKILAQPWMHNNLISSFNNPSAEVTINISQRQTAFKKGKMNKDWNMQFLDILITGYMDLDLLFMQCDQWMRSCVYYIDIGDQYVYFKS